PPLIPARSPARYAAVTSGSSSNSFGAMAATTASASSETATARLTDVPPCPVSARSATPTPHPSTNPEIAHTGAQHLKYESAVQRARPKIGAPSAPTTPHLSNAPQTPRPGTGTPATSVNLVRGATPDQPQPEPDRYTTPRTLQDLLTELRTL